MVVSERSFVVGCITADVFQLQSLVPDWFRLCYCRRDSGDVRDSFRMFWVWEVPRNENLIQKSAYEGPEKRGHQRDPEPVVVTPEGREQ